MPKEISKGEKMLVFISYGAFDLLQIILDIFFVTEWINNVLDFVAGGILFEYARRRKLLTNQKILLLLAAFVGEQIPFINAAPFWVMDVKNLYSGTLNASPAEESGDGPLNQNGARQPASRSEPLNQNGIRLPSGQ